MFTLTTGELAAKLGAELEGAADVVLTGVADLRSAGPGQLAFAAAPHFWPLAAASAAAAVVVPKNAAVPAPKPALAKAEPDPDGLSPTRYGDWVRDGIAVDF